MKFEIRAHEVDGLLDRLPPGVTTLSLDCFDTILWRAVQAPRDVFAGIDLPGGGVEPRVWAEGGAGRVARNRGGSGQYGLGDIYRRLYPNADAARITEAVAHELRLEARHCFAFAPAVALMRAAKARGLGLVIVSDMYLSEAELRALIAEVAGEDVLALADHVFVSFAHGCAKADGLFEIVLDRIGARPEQVLHVGDNVAADYDGAEAAGLHAVLLRQFDEQAERRLRMEAIAGGIIDPEVRIARPFDQFHRAAVALRTDDDPIVALGHDVMGPALHAFALWLKDELDALSATLGRPVRPLFAMRDGHLPLRCFETLFPEAGARPIEISRFVAARASLHDYAALEAYVYDSIDNFPLETLARQLMLRPDEWAAVRRKRTEAEQRTAFTRAVLGQDLSARILKRAAAFGDKLVRHLATAGVGRGDAVMLVDIGYIGTVQNMLAPLLAKRLDLTMAGRFMFLREDRLSGLDKRGMMDIRHYESRTLNAVASTVGVVEQLCNVAQGSTIDFAADGSPIREKQEPNLRQNAIRTRVQEACLAYIADAERGVHRPVASDGVAARARTAGAILVRLVFMPSAAEVDIFEDFDQDMNLGTGHKAKLLDRRHAAEGLRRQGLAYINDVRRMFVPAELQRHGLPLTLTLFSSLRFGLEFRSTDFDTGGVDVPVILADARDQSLLTLRAMPTSEGYYRLLVPVGAGRLTAAVQLGAVCEHLQLDDVRFDYVADMDRLTGHREPIPAQRVADGMSEIAPDMFAAKPTGMILVPPPAGATEAMVLTLLFRPLRWRKAAAQAAIARAA